ncbi:hypothetical protein HDU97_008771 [Phlyctochytrium planicorne]|nr:hypothetical protein HDU97_008771 [Phlyctochytrium planicorne]
MNLLYLYFVLLSFSGLAAAGEDAAQATPPEYAPVDDAALAGDKFKFESENSRVLSIVINSLYKSKEIFLRELISNAADALDKIRFMSLTSPDALASNNRLDIRIMSDRERKLLQITDTGVGMTPDELRKNLGTIAKSGTSEFISAVERNATDLGLIGQFGVGFYSVFLVCDRVTVASKSNEAESQHIWQSTSESDFTIAKDPRGNTLGRGTEITLHLKDDAIEYLETSNLESLIAKYSEFITFPIYIWKNVTVTEEVDEPASEPESEVEDVTDEKKKETIEKTVSEWVVVNQNKPIWARSPSDVSESEYQNFYKSYYKDTTEPLTWIHFRAEGDVDFKSLLYIPARAPPSFLQKADEIVRNIRLFVRKVFITDELDDFWPRWLAFIKGLVDSDDLPLNVSRETLQKHSLLKTIKKKLIAKSLDMISQLSKDKEKYKKFFEQFGVALKLGVIEDVKNRKKLIKALRFQTSSEEHDPLDEYLIQQISDYNGVKLQSVSKPGLLYGDEDSTKEDLEKLSTEFEPLSEWLKTTLSDFIDKVVVSARLTKSPTAILANEFGVSGNMERIMAAQALQSGDNFMKNYYSTLKKTLEINPKHPLIKGFRKRLEAGGELDDLKEQALALYDVTLLRSGFDIKNVPQFSARIERVIRKALNVDLTEEAKVDVKPAAEKDPSEKSEKVTKESVAEDVFSHDEL